MPTPDVLDGMRAPRAVRLESMAARAAAGEAVPDPVLQPGVTVYVSRFKRYRVQITAPRSFVNPVTGQSTEAGPELVAQFDEFVYRNNERDPELRAFIDKTLQSNPYFGKFNGGDRVHFWAADEQKAAQEAARLKSALDTMKSMPKEVVDQFIAELKPGEAEDHALPPATAEPAKAAPPRAKK